MTEWSCYWWESITGAKNFCDAVVESLCLHQNVGLLVPDDLPWRGMMRSTMERMLKHRPEMESFSVSFIDVLEDGCGDDIGNYLLAQFAESQVRDGYRGRQSKEKYIADSHALHDRIIWVKGMNAAQEKKWLTFCRNYVPTGKTDGRIVLELHGSEGPFHSKNLAAIQMCDIVNQYDVLLFNSTVLNAEHRKQYSPIWQQYIANLCATLCQTDAETALLLIGSCDFKSQEPMEGLKIIAEYEKLCRRGEHNADHVLYAIRHENHTLIDIRIWEAQMRTFFPLVELERIPFIKHYSGHISNAIHEDYIDMKTKRKQRIYQYGEPIEDPADAEWGTIYRMTKLRRASDSSQYLLYVPNESSRDRIELLREMRNMLAHGKVCRVDQIAAFINGYPFQWNKA